MEYNSPWGPMVLGELEGALVLCDWKGRKDSQKMERRIERFFAAQMHSGTSPLLISCIKELESYAAGTRKTAINIPYRCAGTDFQNEVWEAIGHIPFGTTCSYKELAQRIGRPHSIRAVAAAAGANALSLIIPCHRVIGSGGDLTGYAGGLEAKKALLMLEAGR